MTKKTFFKRTGITIVLLIGLTLVVVYSWSTMILYKTYPIPLTEIHIPSDSASVAEGERQVQIAHCGDCHGEHFTGRILAKMDHQFELVAPNITQVIPTYSNEQLQRLLRYGVKKNGHTVFVMLAFMYHELKEESVRKMIAYLRTIPRTADTVPIPAHSTYEFLGRLRLIKGEINPIADMIARNTSGRYIHYDTTEVSFGRYLVMSHCTSCHNTDLKGEKGFSPDLIIAAAYKKEDFFRLIRTGVALGGRKDIGLMSEIARKYLTHLNDKEISNIYAYLQTKPTSEANPITKK